MVRPVIPFEFKVSAEMKPGAARMGGISKLQQAASQMTHKSSGPASGVQSPPGFAGVVKQAADKNSVALSALDNDPS